MSQNYQAFLDERCEKLGTNHNDLLTALAFAHFSSELLLKEQMIIPIKKTLNSAGYINAKLIDFNEICQKKSSEIGCFLLIVSWRSFPQKFPMKSADFSQNLPRKSFKI